MTTTRLAQKAEITEQAYPPILSGAEAKKNTGYANVVLESVEDLTTKTGVVIVTRGGIIARGGPQTALRVEQKSSDIKAKTTDWPPFAVAYIPENQQFGRKGAEPVPVPSSYKTTQLYTTGREILIDMLRLKKYKIIHATRDELIFEIAEEKEGREKQFYFQLDLTKGKPPIDKDETRKVGERFMMDNKLSPLTLDEKEDEDEQVKHACQTFLKAGWDDNYLNSILDTLYPISYRDKSSKNTPFVEFKVYCDENGALITGDIDVLLSTSPLNLLFNALKNKKYEHYNKKFKLENNYRDFAKEFLNLCAEFKVDEHWAKEALTKLEGSKEELNPFLLLTTRYLEVFDCKQSADQEELKKRFHELAKLFNFYEKFWIDHLDDYVKKAGRINALQLLWNRFMNNHVGQYYSWYTITPFRHGEETNNPEEDPKKLSPLNGKMITLFGDNCLITQTEDQLIEVCLQLAKSGHYVPIHPGWNIKKWAVVVNELLKEYKLFIHPDVLKNHMLWMEEIKASQGTKSVWIPPDTLSTVVPNPNELFMLKQDAQIQRGPITTLGFKLASIAFHLASKALSIELQLAKTLLINPVVATVSLFLKPIKFTLGLFSALNPIALAKKLFSIVLDLAKEKFPDKIAAVEAAYEDFISGAQNQILQILGLNRNREEAPLAPQQVPVSGTGIPSSLSSTSFMLQALPSDNTSEYQSLPSEMEKEIQEKLLQKMEELEEVKEEVEEIKEREEVEEIKSPSLSQGRQ